MLYQTAFNMAAVADASNIGIKIQADSTNWATVAQTNVGSVGNLQAILSSTNPTAQSWRLDLLPPPTPDSEVQFSISTLANETRYYWKDNGSGYVECNSSIRPTYGSNGSYILSGTEFDTHITIIRGDTALSGVCLVDTQTDNTYDVLDNAETSSMCEFYLLA